MTAEPMDVDVRPQTVRLARNDLPTSSRERFQPLLTPTENNGNWPARNEVSGVKNKDFWLIP